MIRGMLVAAIGLAVFAQQVRDLRFEEAPTPNLFRERGTRWALIVGISTYEFLPPGAQLRFAHRDAEAFAAFLRTERGGAIPANQIRLLTNQRATLASIRAALGAWLVEAAGPQDVVYVFFAGHGVVAERDEGYFLAHDSDPQNLHATGLAFSEVDKTLSERLKAGVVVLAADACHSGRLGWSSFAANDASKASDSLAAVGHGDRSFLKLLASKSSEKSYEDNRWNDGQGIFTYSLLEGLSGKADRDGDGVVRASEAIDYVGRQVAEQTGARQHPRVAGNFDGRLPLALVPAPNAAARFGRLEIEGPAASTVYIDSTFRGAIRADGRLTIDGVAQGAHRIAADFPDGTSFEGSFTLASGEGRLKVTKPSPGALLPLQARIAAGRILEADGAWEYYRSQRFVGAQRAAASAMMRAALETVGQACVGDYVQSTQLGPKGRMLRQAVEAYSRLEQLIPGETKVRAKRLFCLGRLLIAEAKFAEAVDSLQASIRMDPNFACAYNALGVAYERLERPVESRRAFDAAALLTPEWALPPFQIASQLIAKGDLKQAAPYLEKAVSYNPRSVGTRWSLLRLHRLLRQYADVDRDAVELLRLAPGYAPTYLELGRAYEEQRSPEKAAEAYETYLLLAPNYGDSEEIRGRTQRLRRGR